MTNHNKQIDFYMDLLIVEALVGNSSLLKTAQTQDIVSTIIEKVKDYFGTKVDPKDKAGSILNMLAPGIIRATFGAMGMPWLGFFLGLADSVFHFDIASILEKIIGELKEELSGDKKVTSSKVKQIAQSAVESQNTKPSQEDASSAAKEADKAGINIGQEEINKVNDGSFASQLRAAKLIRIAMEDCFINKEAGLLSWLPIFSGKRAQTGSILGKLFGVIFSVALASAGLLVAGDVINKMIGRDNSLDGTIHDGKSTGGTPSTQQLPVSTRPTKPSYVDVPMNSSGNWVENVANNEPSIGQMVMKFAKDVYPLEGQEAAIESNPMFQRLVKMIVWYNEASAGGPVVYIPRMFTTKKQMVDSFVDTLPTNTKA